MLPVHNSTLLLDTDSDFSPVKSADLVTLLNQSSPDSQSQTDFIQRNITAIKHFKRRETKPAPEPEFPPVRIPKPIAEDSHLLRLTHSARCKIVLSEEKGKGRGSRAHTPDVTIRKVKRPTTPQGNRSDRSHSAPRMRQSETVDEGVYQTPSFHDAVEVQEIVVPRLKRGTSKVETSDKPVSKESFERSLPLIDSIRQEHTYPDPFSDTTVNSAPTGHEIYSKVTVKKDRNPPISEKLEFEYVFSSESEGEGQEEIHRYLQHWFSIYYGDFRRLAIQEILGVLIIRGNYKRAQKQVKGISQVERGNKRSNREVLTFREMEKRLDEVLTKGRATITRAGSLTDARSVSNTQYIEKVSFHLSSPPTLPPMEDPTALLKPIPIISTALESNPDPFSPDSLIVDLLINLFAPRKKLLERRYLALSLEAVELKAEAVQGVVDYISAAKKLLVLKQYSAAKEAVDTVFRITEEYTGKSREEYRLARQEAYLWSSWELLLRHSQTHSVDRSVLSQSLENLQSRSMSSREYETLRKIGIIYLYYHSCLWRKEDRALAQLTTFNLGEWGVVVEADLKMRMEEPLVEAAAAEMMLLRLDAATSVRFVLFMRLVQHYSEYDAYEKVISAGRRVLTATPPLSREHSSLVLCAMLKAQGHLDPSSLRHYQLLLDRNDFTYLYQFARVTVKSRVVGSSASAREALELLLAFAQDYAHLRQYLFHFSFWRFMLYKTNCFYRSATQQGCELLRLVTESSIQRQSVERFLGEIQEVKAALHRVYDRCRRQNLQPGQWVEDVVRQVERLDPFLGLCLFIALEKPATLGPYRQILRDYPNRFESYFVNWMRLYRLNKVREKQLKQIEGQEEVDKRDSNHPLSLLPQFKQHLDSIKLLHHDCLSVRLQCLWQVYGKGYGPMRLSDAYRIIQAKSYLRTNYHKAILKLKKATHSGRSAAAMVYYLLAKYQLELEKVDGREVYRELKVYLNSFALQRDMDPRYLAKALCLHAEVEALAGHFE